MAGTPAVSVAWLSAAAPRTKGTAGRWAATGPATKIAAATLNNSGRMYMSNSSRVVIHDGRRVSDERWRTADPPTEGRPEGTRPAGVVASHASRTADRDCRGGRVDVRQPIR